MFNIFTLFGKDESSKWTESFKIPLTLNLRTESINNVRFGDSYKKLFALGRPNNRSPFKNNKFIYHPLGIEIGGENGKILKFEFIMNTSEDYLACNSDLANYASCEFTLLTARGGFLPISKNTTVAEIERILGVPLEKEVDDDKLCVIYHHDRLLLDVECCPDQRIERLYVGLWD